MGMDYTLRQAAPGDRPAIEALFLQMLQTIYQKQDVRGYEDGYLDRFFSGSGDVIFVAQAGQDTVAFLSVEHHREAVEYLYFDDFCVDAAHRGKGLGTALVAMAEQHAGQLGVKLLVLHVEKTNTAALRLYRRLGFVPDEEKGTRLRMLKWL